MFCSDTDGRSLKVLNITNSTVVNNTAGVEGGGVYFDDGGLDPLKLLRLEASNFTANAAGGKASGGAVYLGLAASQSEFILRRLRFDENAARTGVNLFWVLGEDGANHPPQCDNCTHLPDDVALIASSASRAEVFQDGAAVTSIECASGNLVAPGLTFLTVDWYGNKAWLDSSDCASTVTVAADVLKATGQTIASYTDLGASFTELVLTGSPGDTYDLNFTSSERTLEQVSVQVYVQQCVTGQEYHDSIATCHSCPEGSLSFSNTSDCVSCTDDTGTDVEGVVECTGGSTYIVQTGHWVGPGAARCSDDALCFLGRVHPCDAYGACNSDTGGRTGAGAEAVGSLQLCGEGHDPEVVLCAACLGGYQMLETHECRRCPIARWQRSIPAVVMVMVIVVGGFLIQIIMKQVRTTAALERSSSELVGTGKSMHRMIMVRSIFNVIIGHMQIVSQQLLVFDAQSIPSVYRGFLK
ncbi:hypothetical protein CYMTET_35093, partial [Cymbomonas tetramitiformis]